MHRFHIPVMGTAFTIDTALKVAPFGISSVASLVDDTLMEQMRVYHIRELNRPYVGIPKSTLDYRALRISAYLDLLDELVKARLERFLTATDLDGLKRFVKFLPDSELKVQMERALALEAPLKIAEALLPLRDQIKPGSIDVNIMTKVNKENYHEGERLGPEYDDALAALRGFANSNLSAAVVFSAGMNPALYSHITEYKDFFPDEQGNIKKKVILKVSDFRSAFIQGKFLAKKGVWVSEYRIESGLNCGGHAFATQGNLLGPVLEEFKEKKEELRETQFKLCEKALAASGRNPLKPEVTPLRITVQGGVGTAEESEFLYSKYNVDGVGWGSLFLFCPEVVRIDKENLAKLVACDKDDLKMSDASPLGIPFWNLMDSVSEEERRKRIESGKPGSPCPKGYVKVNTEFTKKGICVGSSAYMKLKLKELDEDPQWTPEQREFKKNKLLSISCICHDLAGGATKELDIDSSATAAICPGPNVANFSKVATLDEMIDHIYGRHELPIREGRLHMFLAELELYINHLREELEVAKIGLSRRPEGYYQGYLENLRNGISYYRSLANKISPSEKACKIFLDRLNELDQITLRAFPELYEPVRSGEAQL